MYASRSHFLFTRESQDFLRNEGGVASRARAPALRSINHRLVDGDAWVRKGGARGVVEAEKLPRGFQAPHTVATDANTYRENSGSLSQIICPRMHCTPWFSLRDFVKGSVESTHKVPTSHYQHTKHKTDGRCHRGRVARWNNKPARIFKDPPPPTAIPPSQPRYIYWPHAGSSHDWPPCPRALEQVRPVPRARP